MPQDLIITTRDLAGPPVAWHVYQITRSIDTWAEYIATVEIPAMLDWEDAAKHLFTICQNVDGANWLDTVNWSSKGNAENPRSLMPGDLLVPVDSQVIVEVLEFGFRLHFRAY